MTMPKWGAVYIDPISKQKSTTKPWWLGISQGLYDFGQSLPKVNFGQWGQQISQDWSKMFPSDKPFTTKVTKPTPTVSRYVPTLKPWWQEVYQEALQVKGQQEAEQKKSFEEQQQAYLTQGERPPMARVNTPLRQQEWVATLSIENEEMRGRTQEILLQQWEIEDNATIKGMNIAGEGQSELSRQWQTATAKARLQPQLAAQRRSGMDALGGTLTDTIKQAQSMGIDTSKAEASLGQYEGNKSSQQSEEYRLNLAIRDKRTGQQMIESTWLAQDYPDWYKKYEKTGGQTSGGAQYLDVGGTIVAQPESHPGFGGALAAGFPGGALGGSMGGEWLRSGFSRWAENNPEFKKAIVAQETKMYTDYPKVYPWYQEYRQTEGAEAKPFKEWMSSEPLVQAYLKAEEADKSGPGRTQIPRWAVSKQR